MSGLAAQIWNSWFVRIDRFASVHMVRSQDAENSCAMASCLMVNFKMKKGLMAAGVAAGAEVAALPIPGATYIGYTLSSASVQDAFRSEAVVRRAYEAAAGEASHDWEKQGAWPDFLPSVLQSLRLGKWESVDVGENGLCQAVIDATADGSPCILACSWDGGGGHALVCDETHSFFGTRYLCICDPWDGELRLITGTPGSRVRYDSNVKPISITFGGFRREGGAVGTFDGRIVRRVR